MAVYLYIMYSDRLDDYYVGVSEHPEKRVKYNNMGNKEWSEPGIPWTLAFKKEFPDRGSANTAAERINETDSNDYVKAIIEGKEEI